MKLIDRCIEKLIIPHLRNRGVLGESLMNKVARFVACEAVNGDFFEFGVFQGASLIKSYHALKNGFEARVKQSAGSDDSITEKRMQIWDRMRFFAFDSFEGLPSLEEKDQGTEDFKAGMYACSEQRVRENLRRAKVDVGRVQMIKGWFNETCNIETAKKFGMKKASVIWIDGDLYSSTRDVLNFVEHLLQDGTVIIFDDWFSYRGNPSKGEQFAFYEWIQKQEVKSRFSFQEYQRESWKRIAFIASARVS